MQAEGASRKRKAEDGVSDVGLKASKLAKTKSNQKAIPDPNSSDPEERPAPTDRKRVLYPEGPLSVLNDPDLLSILRMDWDDSQVEDFQERYKKLVRVPLAHKDLKSPMGYWASEDPATSSLWRQHFATRKPKEPRNKKGNELAKNVYDIQAEDYLELTPGENTIVYDELDGSIAGVVLWDFLKDGCIEGSLGHGLIEYIDKTICSQGKMLRDSRRDDGGKMVQIGYTSARIQQSGKSKKAKEVNVKDDVPMKDNLDANEIIGTNLEPSAHEDSQKSSSSEKKFVVSLPLDPAVEIKSSLFDWSRAMTSKLHSVGELRGLVHEATSIQSILWTACRKVLPSEIIDDFMDTMESHCLPRMDWNMKGKPVSSLISVKSNGRKYDLSEFELGPPSAVIAMDYTKVIHSECNANNYVISFTTNRTVGENGGLNFLFAKYGVKVLNRRNTVIVHRVTDAHGTTIPHRSPEENLKQSTASQQSGISMLIGNSLLNAWSKFNGETTAEYESKQQELKQRRDGRRGEASEATLGSFGEGRESEGESSDEGEEEESD